MLFKKTTLFIMILCLSIFSLLNISTKIAYAYSILSFQNNNLINVGVSLSKSDDPYTSMVKQSLKKIENENKDKIKFTFFDSQNNEAVQVENLVKLLDNSNNYDLLLLNLVETKANLMENIVNRAKPNNKPVIFFNVEPTFIPSSIKNYNKAVIIGTDSKQSGILQGKIVADIWNANKNIIDKNNNNTLEYVMLQGKPSEKESIDRSKYSVSTIKDAGIQTKELSSQISDWNKELAKNNVDALFSRFGSNIEAIIANNDSMAIGAIEALQKYGYNKGDKSKNIVVVGIDGIPEAKELVDSGIMSGTVIQSPEELANALYTVGMNLINNMPTLKGSNYMFNETGITIELPYYEYVKEE